MTIGLRNLANKILKVFSPDYVIVPNIYGRSAYKLQDIREDPLFFELSRPVVEAGNSCLYYDRLYHIYQVVTGICAAFPPPHHVRILEVGVFRGGTSFFIASLLSRLAQGRITQFGVDTFTGHSGQDILNGIDGEHMSGIFNNTSLEKVKQYLTPFPFVKLIPKRIQEALGELGSEGFDFIHLDVDIYEPTQFVLETFWDNMPIGGQILVDDYRFKTCPGIEKAITEFTTGRNDVLSHDLMTGQCLLIKVK